MDTLLIDNYDSFTYNLCDYLRQLGIDVSVVRNDQYTLQELKARKFHNIVLSAGPETPEKAGLVLDLIHEYHAQLPILGICLGHQALGTYFGARLVKAEIPLHGMQVPIQHNGHALFGGIEESFEVMCYHSLVLEGMNSTDMEVLATNTFNDPMAILHSEHQCFGVQYHPESILTPSGMKLLENWFRLITRV